MKDFTDLEVWKRAHQTVLSVYKITKYLPPEERFILISQILRAAISIPANIAEGFTQKTKKSKINMYNISLSSLQELKYYLLLCKDLNYYTQIKNIYNQCEEIGKMLNGLINSIKNNPSY